MTANHLIIPDSETTLAYLADLKSSTYALLEQAQAALGNAAPEVGALLAQIGDNVKLLTGDLDKLLELLYGLADAYREVESQRDAALQREKVARADADEAYAAGWDEASESDSVREAIVEELQIEADEEFFNDGFDYGKKTAKQEADAEIDYLTTEMDKIKAQFAQALTWYEENYGDLPDELIPEPLRGIAING